MDYVSAPPSSFYNSSTINLSIEVLVEDNNIGGKIAINIPLSSSNRERRKEAVCLKVIDSINQYSSTTSELNLDSEVVVNYINILKGCIE